MATRYLALPRVAELVVCEAVTPVILQERQRLHVPDLPHAKGETCWP